MSAGSARSIFFRFWQQTGDRLFVSFASAFGLLAVSYALVGLVAFATEWRVYVFAVRLVVFCMIIYGIVEKTPR